MCWRPIGGEGARVEGPAGAAAFAVPPRRAREGPPPAVGRGWRPPPGTTMIPTPGATTQRFRRRGPPDSTRRCGPAVRCCGPWLVRGGGGTRLFFFLATTRRKVSSSRARLGAEEFGDGAEVGDHRCGRKRVEEA